MFKVFSAISVCCISAGIKLRKCVFFLDIYQLSAAEESGSLWLITPIQIKLILKSTVHLDYDSIALSILSFFFVVFSYSLYATWPLVCKVPTAHYNITTRLMLRQHQMKTPAFLGGHCIKVGLKYFSSPFLPAG